MSFLSKQLVFWGSIGAVPLLLYGAVFLIPHEKTETDEASVVSSSLQTRAALPPKDPAFDGKKKILRERVAVGTDTFSEIGIRAGNKSMPQANTKAANAQNDSPAATGQKKEESSETPQGFWIEKSASGNPDFDSPSAPSLLGECPQDSGDDRHQCFAKIVRRMVHTDGIRVALRHLEDYASVHPASWRDSECHLLAHEIGREGYLYHQNNPGPHFGECLPRACASGGCYHGFVLEFLDQKKAADPARELVFEDFAPICAGIPNSEPGITHGLCLHGMGHAFLIYKEDIKNALGLCDGYSSPRQIACYVGVFHETTNESPIRPIRYNRAGDPIFPCGELAERHLDFCYFYAAGKFMRMFREYSSDYPRAMQFCNEEVPEKYRHMCYYGTVTELLGQPRTDGHKLLQSAAALCDEHADSRFADGCYYGALEQVMKQDYSGGNTRAYTLCRLFKSDGGKHMCYWSFGNGLGSGNRDIFPIVSACLGVEVPYIFICLRAAGIASFVPDTLPFLQEIFSPLPPPLV